jgi:hypothetical protein
VLTWSVYTGKRDAVDGDESVSFVESLVCSLLLDREL